MKAILYHEFSLHRHGFGSYIAGAFLLEGIGIAALMYNINSAIANFEYVFGSASLILALIVPILTMKTISEERKLRTDMLLYSLPLSMTEIVGGKFLAVTAVFAAPLFLVIFYPIIINRYGDVSFLTTYGSLFGFILLGASLIAIGIFISSLTENMGLAAGITAAVIVLNYYSVTLAEYATSTAIGSLICLSAFVLLIFFVIRWFTGNYKISLIAGGILEAVMLLVFIIKSELFEGLVPSIMNQLSLFQRFNSFVYGVFDLTAVVYYLTVIAFFLFLTVQVMEKRRYN